MRQTKQRGHVQTCDLVTTFASKSVLDRERERETRALFVSFCANESERVRKQAAFVTRLVAAGVRILTNIDIIPGEHVLHPFFLLEELTDISQKDFSIHFKCFFTNEDKFCS
jgi:hypothetical protein